MMAIKLALDTNHIMSGEAYDSFIDTLCENIPQCWDTDEAVESIIIAYIKRIEPSARGYGMHHTQWCNGGCT